MAQMTQAQARSAAIAAGTPVEEVDAFIAREGGARVSAQRITSAFGVAGSTGTNDLSTFHAQKAAPGGADASAKGTYLSGSVGSAGGTSAGGSSEAGGGGAGFGDIGAGGPIGGVPPSVQKAALTGLSAGDQTGTGVGGGDGSPGGVTNPFAQGGPGQLRQNLGNRLYPQESEALAGLKKAY